MTIDLNLGNTDDGCSRADVTTHHHHVTRVPELWFEDGGIIIQAGSSLFRVSRGVLGARSTVFKDMFESCTLGPPSATTSDAEEDAGTTEMMDGVPVLRLQDDARDVEPFLKAIFDSSYFEPYPSKTSLSAIAGVLRLSHKYDVGYLRQRALDHLRPAFPNTLYQWELRAGTTLLSSFERHSGLLEAFVVVQLAIEADAPWLLPGAVYQCCTYPIEDILDLDTASSSAGLGPYPNFISAQKLCLSTWPKIRASYHTLYGHLRTTSCLIWPKCLVHLSYAAPSYSRRVASSATQNNPLDVLDNNYWASLNPDLCNACFQESKMFYTKWRSDLWSELPKMVGLKGWDALNNSSTN